LSRPDLTVAEQSIATDERGRTLLRAFDQELEWYFTYAEGAKRVGNVTLLPANEAAQIGAAADGEAATIRRALELATTVQSTLGAVSTRHAGVLRAVYTPRRWPITVTREFQRLSAIAVRLVCSANPWPERSSHDGLERAAALDLARQIARNAARPAALRKEARRLMGSAITAYVRARAKGGAPFVIPAS
jgi:hypothetical protein